jgi:hypothetical protein
MQRAMRKLHVQTACACLSLTEDSHHLAVSVSLCILSQASCCAEHKMHKTDYCKQQSIASLTKHALLLSSKLLQLLLQHTVAMP